MIPSTSPARSSSAMSRRTSRPPRSSERSSQEKSGALVGVHHRFASLTTRARGASVEFGDLVRPDDLVLAVLDLNKELAHALLEFGCLVAEAVVRESAELPDIRCSCPSCRRRRDRDCRGSSCRLAAKSSGFFGRFPGPLEVLDDVVAIAGIDEAHDCRRIPESARDTSSRKSCPIWSP